MKFLDYNMKLIMLIIRVNNKNKILLKQKLKNYIKLNLSNVDFQNIKHKIKCK